MSTQGVAHEISYANNITGVLFVVLFSFLLYVIKDILEDQECSTKRNQDIFVISCIMTCIYAIGIIGIIIVFNRQTLTNFTKFVFVATVGCFIAGIGFNIHKSLTMTLCDGVTIVSKSFP